MIASAASMNSQDTGIGCLSAVLPSLSYSFLPSAYADQPPARALRRLTVLVAANRRSSSQHSFPIGRSQPFLSGSGCAFCLRDQIGANAPSSPDDWWISSELRLPLRIFTSVQSSFSSSLAGLHHRGCSLRHRYRRDRMDDDRRSYRAARPIVFRLDFATKKYIDSKATSLATI